MSTVNTCHKISKIHTTCVRCIHSMETAFNVHIVYLIAYNSTVIRVSFILLEVDLMYRIKHKVTTYVSAPIVL